MIRALIGGLVGAIVLGHLPAIVTEEAHADPAADDHFIAMLENAGLGMDDRDHTIAWGHTVCYLLWAGDTTVDDIVNSILGPGGEPRLDETGAKTAVAIAIQAFCPNIGARYRTPLSTPMGE